MATKKKSNAEHVRESEAKAEAQGHVYLRGSVRIDERFARLWTRLKTAYGTRGALEALLKNYANRRRESD